MTATDHLLYELYDVVLDAVRSFAADHGIRAAMPSPVAPALEFPPWRSVVASSEPFADLILPASNTYQKQVAAAHLGSVYCIAPCYRRDAQTNAAWLHLDVFHQIEFELRAESMERARTMAAELLTSLWSRTRDAGFNPPEWSFSDCDIVDLASSTALPTALVAYDAWTIAAAEELDRPVWVVHTPRTPPPRLNRDLPGAEAPPLTLGFDLLTPAGELLSGGERDVEQTRAFYGCAPWICDLELGSSGFGIGLERTIRAILRAPTVGDVVLRHCNGRI